MGANWFKGIVILAVLALLWALMTAPNRSKSMGEDIQAALSTAGYSDTQVDMAGNVATLTGETVSEKTKSEITAVAANTQCSKCNDKKSWHEVANNMTVKKAPVVQAAPAQSPYTFSAVKTDDGGVVLKGWVQNEEQRVRVLARANNAYSSVLDRTVKIASGAPNADWEQVLNRNIDELKLLKSGRFTMEDNTSFISGKAETAEVRARINEMVSGLPAGYEGAANITVPDTAALNVGEVKSEAICQTLLDDLKTGKKINFAYGKAAIRGAESFDLMNSLVSAAKQCSSFKISVEGHTDSDGDEDYNLGLSESRANLVVAYLSENGIDSSRMTATGYGETKPIGDNSTDAGKAENRRIEFTVTQSK